jgi:diguanylate cyclase (GGDEF)-like protein
MDDLFGVEQKIYDDAVSHSKDLGDSEIVDKSLYIAVVKEYGRLLKQLRRATKLNDRTAKNLSDSNLDLLDKVHYDALTGIYNRRFMEDNLGRVIKSLARSGGTLSLLMLDVDFFKKYNDTYGHGEGDVCLKSVAETITASLSRPDDFAARYGGEEFAVILPDTDESGARFIAGKIIENMRNLNIPHGQSEVADCVTISIGATTGEVEHTQSGADYVKRADKALYESKQTGRNRYTYIDFKEEI